MIREATPSEALAIYPGTQGYVTTVLLVTDEHDSILGWTCITKDSRGLGLPVVHDTFIESPDRTDFLRLIRAARAKVKSMGFNRILIHEESTTPAEIGAFWRKRGALPTLVVLALDI